MSPKTASFHSAIIGIVMALILKQTDLGSGKLKDDWRVAEWQRKARRLERQESA